ncbi:MAG: radical SAM protein [Nitrospiraceae bacterium]|nr:radical SAM protein [Nitrospiraceae bacterium]
MGKILFAGIILTYRCNARCHMCNTWRYPTRPGEEIKPDIYEKLPAVDTLNVTGGEPFMREDLEDIIPVLRKKTKRLVISTNGFFTRKILKLASRHRDVGIRISIEGLPRVNDELRGIKDGFDRALRTLIRLHDMGARDIGFGITVSDRNTGDLMELYRLSRMLGFEFATAAVHNSFYFHKFDNGFAEPERAADEVRKLVNEQLKSKRAKEWFRAYFNHGLINYIRGGARLLPCGMAHDSFFLDPMGEVLPCNVLYKPMGNLRTAEFGSIWGSEAAEEARLMVKNCRKNCWMTGSVSQAMKKNIWRPAGWIAARKLAPWRLACGGIVRRPGHNG